MSTRPVRLIGMGLLCSLLPLTSIQADAPVAADLATRLESLLMAHDVRNVIRAHDVREAMHAMHAKRANSSDCLQTEAERGR
jgi:hypothetical protein